MSECSFRLILAGIELSDEQLNIFYEAGCDDATFARERDGSVVAYFDREADTPEAAVLAAITDIENTNADARVIKVATDDDWLTATEIAQRVGRTRQNIGQLLHGIRGTGDFPKPVARQGSTNPLWSWADVEQWFERYEPDAVPAHGPRLSADFLAEVNNRLDLRERLRYSPNAPWRQKLDETLPLVS